MWNQESVTADDIATPAEILVSDSCSSTSINTCQSGGLNHQLHATSQVQMMTILQLPIPMVRPQPNEIPGINDFVVVEYAGKNVVYHYVRSITGIQDFDFHAKLANEQRQQQFYVIGTFR